MAQLVRLRSRFRPSAEYAGRRQTRSRVSVLSLDLSQIALADFVVNFAGEERPESLDSFIDSLNRLALPRALSHQVERGDASEERVVPGLNAKKSHEVSRFARLVGDLATELGVRRIIVRPPCHPLHLSDSLN